MRFNVQVICVSLAGPVCLSALPLASQTSPSPIVQTMKVDVQLYQVPVLILDKLTHTPVAAVPRERIQVSIDDGPFNTPAYLTSKPDAPLSIAVLFDVSGSQSGLIHAFAADISALAGPSFRPVDELAFYTFGQRVYRTADFEKAQPEALSAALTSMGNRQGEEIVPQKHLSGGTRLWDALDAAVSELSARKGTPVILVLTDGGDNASHREWQDVMRVANQHGVSIFGLKYKNMMSRLSMGMSLGMLALDSRLTALCEGTGGIVFTTGAKDRLETLNRFMTLVRSRFLVEFPPTATMKPHDNDLDLKVLDPRLQVIPSAMMLADRSTLHTSPLSVSTAPPK